MTLLCKIESSSRSDVAADRLFRRFFWLVTAIKHDLFLTFYVVNIISIGEYFNYGFAASRRSRISRSRSGVLSMDRPISRTLHGLGLRSFTTPSLSTNTIWNPRGRSFDRIGDRANGSVSVSTITSRSRIASSPSSNMSICCWNRGSAGVSAKTMMGRLTHRNSLRSLSPAGRTNSSSAGADPSAAKAASGNSAEKTKASVRVMGPPARMNIAPVRVNATGDLNKRFKFLRFAARKSTPSETTARRPRPCASRIEKRILP